MTSRRGDVMASRVSNPGRHGFFQLLIGQFCPSGGSEKPRVSPVPAGGGRGAQLSLADIWAVLRELCLGEASHLPASASLGGGGCGFSWPRLSLWHLFGQCGGGVAEENQRPLGKWRPLFLPPCNRYATASNDIY